MRPYGHCQQKAPDPGRVQFDGSCGGGDDEGGSLSNDRRMLPGFAEKLHIGKQNPGETSVQKCLYSVIFGGK